MRFFENVNNNNNNKFEKQRSDGHAKSHKGSSAARGTATGGWDRPGEREHWGSCTRRQEQTLRPGGTDTGVGKTVRCGGTTQLGCARRG